MKHKSIFAIATLGLISLTILSASLLSIPSSYADTSITSSTAITVSSACSITADNTIPHTAIVFPGREETEIGNTTMTVECNDGSGSKVYAIGYSDDTFGNTNMVNASTNTTIPTGTGTSSSNWSMKLSIPTGNTAPTIRSDSTYDFTDYEEIPDEYTLVATFSSTVDGANNSSLSATYRTYIGDTQAPGTFTGKVKYTLVHPSTASAPSVYTISYADASNEGTGLPPTQIGVAATTIDVELSSIEAAREDYIFVGWCSVNNSADTTACSGTTYDLGDTYTITSSGSDINVTLYAVWESTCVVNTPYMQDWNGANSLAEEERIYLRDKRDGQCYSVAKLKDGKVWMTTNLNLAGGTTLSYENTDFESSYTIPTTDGWQANGTLPESSTSWSSSTLAALYNSGNKTNCGAGQNMPCYSYYTWDAAVLGSGRGYSSNTDAPYSICPKGWRLPRTRGSYDSDWQTLSDFYQLAVAYGMTAGDTSEATSSFYDNAGPGTIPNFILNSSLGSGGLSSDGRVVNIGSYLSAYGYTDGRDYPYVFEFDGKYKYIYTSVAYSGPMAYGIRCIKR